MHRFFGTLAIVAASVVGTAAGATTFPGPDGGGYTGTAVTNALRDISTSGTFLSLSDDDVSGAISLGFSFDFYGNAYTQAYVSSNGFLTFDSLSSSGCCNGQELPTGAHNPDNLVAGLWSDLNVPQGNIRYEILGTPGNREFVVGFYNVRFYYYGGANTFEMILHEGSNAIELQYGDLSTNRHSVTSGIENAGGTYGLQIYNGLADATGVAALQGQGFLLSTNSAAVPLPATLPLILAGFGALGLIGARRRRA